MYGLEIKHLTVAYQDQPILKNISFAIRQGSFVAITGPNGAGKTTLLKTIVQLIPSIAGSILVNGLPFDAKKRCVAYVPQRSMLDWDFPLCVLDVVLMGCYAQLGIFERPSPVHYAKARQVLDGVGLLHMADCHIGQLSGGQQQRLLVARALMQNADLFLLDEPLSGVDAHYEQVIFTLLKNASLQGKTIMMVHHQVERVMHYFDAILSIDATGYLLQQVSQKRHVRTNANIEQ